MSTILLDNTNNNPYFNPTNPINPNLTSINNSLSKSKNLDIILMEKDKEIIDLSNTNSNLNTQIDSLNKIIKQRDLEIASLKSDINSLISDKKINAQEINNLKIKVNELNSVVIKKDKQLENFSTKNNGDINSMHKALDINLNEYEKLFNNYHKLHSELNELNNKSLLKDKENLALKKSIYDLKNENKKIFLMAKDLSDKDELINDIKRKNKINEEKFFSMEKENKFLKEQISNINKNNEFEFLMKTKQNFSDYENMINDLKNSYNKKCAEKDKIINDYKNKINSFNSRNENLISFIFQQIQNIQDKIDSNYFYNDDNNFLVNGNKFMLIDEDNCKYELIRQNFLLLLQKISDFKKKCENEKNMKINLNYDNNNDKFITNKLFDDFYTAFVNTINNYYKENNNMRSKNIYPMNNLPNFSMQDSKQKKYQDILITIKMFINQNNLLNRQLISYIQDNNNNNNYNSSNKNINYNMNQTNPIEDLQNSDIKQKLQEMTNLLIKTNQYLNMSRQDNRLIQQKYNNTNYNNMMNNENNQNDDQENSYSNNNASQNFQSNTNFAVNQSNHINNVYNSSNSLNNDLAGSPQLPQTKNVFQQNLKNNMGNFDEGENFIKNEDNENALNEFINQFSENNESQQELYNNGENSNEGQNDEMYNEGENEEEIEDNNMNIDDMNNNMNNMNNINPAERENINENNINNNIN